jgi:hypothetical protein
VSPEIIDALDKSIREELQKTSHFFFLWVLISAFVVGAGVALEGPELLHEMWPRLFTCFTRGSVTRIRTFKRVIKKIGFWGWLLVVVGILGEGIFEALQNRAEGQLQTFNDILLADAQRNAGNARASAIDAANASSRADSESEKATASSANAMALAQGARKEADTFEKDIVFAKRQAADAESHLADALKQAEQAQEVLYRIKTPRSLVTTGDMLTTLKKFRGTKYVFRSVGQDDESIILLKAIDKFLKDCGWQRDKSIPGFPAINPNGKDESDFSVTIGFTRGVTVSTQAVEEIKELQSRPLPWLPPQLQAAIGLRQVLSIAIKPSTETAVYKQVNVENGNSETVTIDVGEKPLE